MIERIQIRGFKSLRDISLTLGPLNVLIGTNASGKSNLFDAMRVVQGVGHNFSIDEIFNGKPRTSSSEMWEGIRGGSAGASFQRWNRAQQKLIKQIIHIELTLSSPSFGRNFVEYSIGISPSRRRVVSERFSAGGTVVYDTDPVDNAIDRPTVSVRYYKGKGGRQSHLHFEPGKPVLQQIGKHRECSGAHTEIIDAALQSMGDMQRLDPVPAILREYSRGPYVPRMGERGENFAALVSAILQNSEAADAYVSWLRQLTPSEMQKVTILEGALGEPLFAAEIDHKTFAAPVLSDGTLRFAAIAAAFFQPDMPDLLMIEELENGIHPTRLRLLIDLLKSQARRPEPQVLVTTHSPVVLSWLADTDYEHVFFCSKDEGAGASMILPVTQIPGFSELVSRQPISDLFAEGWLESRL